MKTIIETKLKIDDPVYVIEPAASSDFYKIRKVKIIGFNFEVRKNKTKINYFLSSYGYDPLDGRDFFIDKKEAEKALKKLNGE